MLRNWLLLILIWIFMALFFSIKWADMANGMSDWEYQQSRQEHREVVRDFGQFVDQYLLKEQMKKDSQKAASDLYWEGQKREAYEEEMIELQKRSNRLLKERNELLERLLE